MGNVDITMKVVTATENRTSLKFYPKDDFPSSDRHSFIQQDEDTPPIRYAHLLREENAIVVNCFHVSCASDEFDKDESYTGVVLYSCDGKSEWNLGGRKCKSGYIILKKGKNLKSNINPKPSLHSQCFEYAFGITFEECRKEHNIIGGGFSYDPENGFKFNSSTFNEIDDGYNGNRTMNRLEQKWIKIAIENWGSGKQNTLVESSGFTISIE